MSELFQLGRVVITTGARDKLHEVDVYRALERHQRGDWGELSDEDRLENERSLERGYRLLSAYSDRHKTAFWIITESDRSVTTILLPDDY